jgi:hypothetical protein
LGVTSSDEDRLQELICRTAPDGANLEVLLVDDESFYRKALLD